MTPKTSQLERLPTWALWRVRMSRIRERSSMAINMAGRFTPPPPPIRSEVYEAAIKAAREAGDADGKARAQTEGPSEREGAAHVLAYQWGHTYNEEPPEWYPFLDLSGEFADEPTNEDVADRFLGNEGTPEERTEIVDTYESAFEDALDEEMTRLAIEQFAPTEAALNVAYERGFARGFAAGQRNPTV